jgi:hypothetical protein
MSDNLDNLFKAARAARPDTARVEYGFETRLLARLRAERTQAVPWLAFTWKLMPVFAAIVVALGVWNFTGDGTGATDLRSAIAGDESSLALHLTGEQQ